MSLSDRPNNGLAQSQPCGEASSSEEVFAGLDAEPAAAHDPGCPTYKARMGAVGIECEHGYDYCPICDRCTCGPFQARVEPWMRECFGDVIPFDKVERADRFLEEALELAQTTSGFTADRAHALVDYVFNRPVGQPAQEVGGVMVALAAYCLANDLDMAKAGEAELARIWTKVEQIRAKQAAKPTGSALPIAPPPADLGAEGSGAVVKVVVNRCFGGFGVSLQAARRMAALGHRQAAAEVAEYDGKVSNPSQRTPSEAKWGVTWYGSGICRDRDERTDPILVRVVEEMGEAASDELARLEVAEVPADARWYIHEYDGSESVYEEHRTW